MAKRGKGLLSLVLRDSLFHFMLLGMLLFGGYGFFSREDDAQRDAIVVTQGRIESLATTFARSWQRPPTDAELQALVDDYVREEACAREAVALGLDKDDPIIRRRLRQKVEFLLQDAPMEEPTDDELAKFLNEHAETFRREPQYTFRQVYLDARRRGESLAGDAERLLAQLNTAGSTLDPDTAGDTQLLATRFVATPRSEIVRDFGEAFAARLESLPIGRWEGPVESGYGAHLLFVSERLPGSLPKLDEIRKDVQQEWENAKRIEAKERFYASLLERYPVTIEGIEGGNRRNDVGPKPQ